jgi:type II secretory pathway pseudopilin PulG
VKRKKTGLTMIELLIVLGIIALLVGLLVPALNTVRNMARETKQQAQLTTIEMALAAFKNEYGDYPPSEAYSRDTLVEDYCGAQKLAEALFGRDLLGFHPDSTWSATDPTYYALPPDSPTDDNLRRRRGLYLEQGTASVFTLGSLFRNATGSLKAYTHVICDVFKTAKVTIPGGTTTMAGTPVLYYKANTSSKSMNPSGRATFVNQIYNANDNLALINLGSLPPDSTVHKLGDDNGIFEPIPPFSGYTGTGEYFYNPDYKIIDTKAMAASRRLWPYRPDSYILISAGADGLYGTPDDITNFGN